MTLLEFMEKISGRIPLFMKYIFFLSFLYLTGYKSKKEDLKNSNTVNKVTPPTFICSYIISKKRANQLYKEYKKDTSFFKYRELIFFLEDSLLSC